MAFLKKTLAPHCGERPKGKSLLEARTMLWRAIFLLASFFPSTEKVAKYVSFANANSSSFAKQNSLSKTVGLATQ